MLCGIEFESKVFSNNSNFRIALGTCLKADSKKTAINSLENYNI